MSGAPYDLDSIFARFVTLTRDGKGVPPTIREMMDATGVRSSSHMYLLLERLVADGRLERYARGDKGLRGFRVADGMWLSMSAKHSSGANE